MPTFTFTPADGTPQEFTDHTDGYHLVSISGTGAIDGLVQAVETPGRDGETYIRTVLPARYIIGNLALKATTPTALWLLRRTLVAALNPKLGPGVISWTPVDGGATYLISALYAGGAGLDVTFTKHVLPFALSFRCSDPAWRVSPVNVSPLIVPDSGLSVPIEIPLSVSVSTITNTIANSGDLDSYPVVTADGPFEGLTVRNTTTGLSVSFPGLVVADGETLTIDMDARTASVDGTNVMPYRSADSQAWPLVPGNNSITATTVSGGTTVTLTWWTRLLGV